MAALMVVYGHAGYFGWVPLLSGLATTGVFLFFFLSGFLMAHLYTPDSVAASDAGALAKHWGAFLLRRFVRVYPPYVLAPILGYLVFLPSLAPGMEPVPYVKGTFSDLLGRIAEFTGNTGIYWTVKVELVFYLFFPLIITAAVLTRRAAWALLGLAIVLAFLSQFPAGIGGLTRRLPFAAHWASFFVLFVTGALAALMIDRLPDVAWGRAVRWPVILSAGFIVLALVVGVCAAFRVPQAVHWRFGWLLAPVFFMIFAGLLRSESAIRRLLSAPPAILCGKVSYSLYLVHMIGLNVVNRYLPGLLHNVVGVVIIMVPLVALYYLAAERPFVRLSKRIGAGRPARGGVSRPIDRH